MLERRVAQRFTAARQPQVRSGVCLGSECVRALESVVCVGGGSVVCGRGTEVGNDRVCL